MVLKVSIFQTAAWLLSSKPCKIWIAWTKFQAWLDCLENLISLKLETINILFIHEIESAEV